MSKQIPKNELDEILNIVARFPSGVPLGKIIESLNTPIPTRNLQTRLVYLVKKGLLHAEGRARGRLYKRVSRLAANISLIQNNLCPLSFVDVPQQTYVNGLLGVYELNRIELLRDVFVWAYERSCLRYSITRRELGDPDTFRIRYRKLITEIVARIVRGCLDKTAAIAAISEYARVSIPPEDQAHFIETVERDVMSLHEGNIARHRLRSSEYEAWHKTWV